MEAVLKLPGASISAQIRLLRVWSIEWSLFQPDVLMLASTLEPSLLYCSITAELRPPYSLTVASAARAADDIPQARAIPNASTDTPRCKVRQLRLHIDLHEGGERVAPHRTP